MPSWQAHSKIIENIQNWFAIGPLKNFRWGECGILIFDEYKIFTAAKS